jgi:TetR/AcrR family fatty acid metabolism transcriptional regulator
MTDRSVSDRKRLGILCAARAVFSRKGYAEAAVDDVAEEAHIAKGTLYLYFKSKEELYLAALVSDLQNMSTEARRDMEAAETFREKLKAFLRVRLEYCKSRQDFLRIYLAEYGSMFVKAPVNREMSQLFRENMRYVAKVVEQARNRGEIRTESAGAAAGAIFDISRGLMERRLLGWKEFRPHDEIEFAVELLLAGIGCEQRAAVRRGKRP